MDLLIAIVIIGALGGGIGLTLGRGWWLWLSVVSLTTMLVVSILTLVDFGSYLVPQGVLT